MNLGEKIVLDSQSSCIHIFEMHDNEIYADSIVIKCKKCGVEVPILRE